MLDLQGDVRMAAAGAQFAGTRISSGPAAARSTDAPLPSALARLPARERQIAAGVHRLGEGTAEDIRAGLAVPLSNSAVRTMLNRLVAKGLLRKRKDGKRFVYLLAAAPNERACEAALRQLSRDYFDGSLLDTAMALLALAGNGVGDTPFRPRHAR